MPTQLARFLRLFAFTAVPATLAAIETGHSLGWPIVVSVLVPSAETAWRAVFPATPDGAP